MDNENEDPEDEFEDMDSPLRIFKGIVVCLVLDMILIIVGVWLWQVVIPWFRCDTCP